MASLFQPDVWLWDLGWDPGPTLERLGVQQGSALPRLVAPAAVALVANESQAHAAWAAGLRSLLLRDAETPRLLAALEAAAQGLVVLDPALATAVKPNTENPPLPPVEPLTPRELQVLRLLAEGLPNKAIAQRLDISEHTVKFHVNAILGKLGVGSRTEAVIHATRLGLILL